METDKIIELLERKMNIAEVWFTTKLDPTYAIPNEYIQLNEYGDIATKQEKERVANQILDIIGDGAIDMEEAVDVWLQRSLQDCKIDFTYNLKTPFKLKPVIDKIDAYQLPKEKNSMIVESKDCLTETSMIGLSEKLDDMDNIDATGIVDGVLVVTDPEITSQDYDKVIARAQEIVESTPEGEIPFMEDYINSYVQICPLCGKSFVTKELLGSGDSCPLCNEIPENYITVGKLQQEDNVEEEEDKPEEDTIIDSEEE